MPTIADRRCDFIGQVRHLFTQPDLFGLIVRPVDPPAGPAVTVAYISGLMDPSDLERLVLVPLASGLPDAPPDTIARSSRFPAPELRAVNDTKALQDGLLGGLAALHIAGHKGTLLVGTGQPPKAKDAFGYNLGENVNMVRQVLPRADLRVEMLQGPEKSLSAVLYLHGTAAPGTVQAVRGWARNLRAKKAQTPLWKTLPDVLRLPPAVEAPKPAMVADALRHGYIAVLADHLPGALLAPMTLDLLLTGPNDVTLSPALRRAVILPRLYATGLAMTLGAWFVAVSSYHHSLIPGPFLMALASSRRNMPFPIVLEMLLVLALDEGISAAVKRLEGQRWTFLAILGIALALMAALQAGVIGPLSAIIGIAIVVALQILPNPALGRAARIWAYGFIAAAAGLGVYGMALLAFVLFVYLGEERPFGHPLRRPPGAMVR